MPPKILIVVDHGPMRHALREWLETVFPGCRVVEATSGKEAIAKVEAGSPHVVVLDTGFPAMNYLGTVTHLRAVVPATPIVVLTNYEPEVHSVLATANGATACVSMDRITELQPTLAGLLYARMNWLDTDRVGGDNLTVITG